MVHWMREHKRKIFAVITVIVVPTFVVWGGYAKSSKAKREAEENRAKTIATVGGVPITVAEYEARLREEAQRRAQYGGEQPTLEQMGQDGTAERVLNTMIDTALLRMESDKLDAKFDPSYLIQRLKDDPYFQDESGKFSSAQWNTWVDASGGQNWNEIYASVTEQLSREVFMKEVTAPGRLLDNSVREEFINNHTKLQIKFVAVAPKVEPTQEQIQAEYDKDPTRYQIPEKRTVQYLAVSLAPPRPAIVDELVTRIRNGELFSDLAKQYSEAPDKDSGGAMGWVDEKPDAPEFMKTLFATPVGTVSAPVEANGVYYIFAVDEEKTDPASGVRSVNAKQIQIRPKLEDAEKAAREQQAEQIASKLKEGADINAVAAENNLTVGTASDVSVESTEIAGLPPTDTYPFRTDVATVAEGGVSEVIKGRANLYVAKVTQVVPPVVRPLGDVQEKVKEDTIQTIKRSEDYKKQLDELGAKIAAGAKSLQEVVTNFPDLGLEIKETKEFTRRDWLLGDGLFLQTVDIFEAVGKGDVGAFAGPLQGMQAESYFIELMKKTPPTDDDWNKAWPEEEKTLRKNSLIARQNAVLMDYLADLRERSTKETPIQRDNETINKLLNPPQEEPNPEENAAGTTGDDSIPAAPMEMPAPVDLGPPASE